MDKEALGEVFLPVLHFHLVNGIPQMAVFTSIDSLFLLGGQTIFFWGGIV
jgi:hypothetical protein